VKVRAVLFYFRDRSSEGNRADFEIGSLDELESVLESRLYIAHFGTSVPPARRQASRPP
jgi:hypothetical protein